MDGPAKSRLRSHIRIAKHYLDLYKDGYMNVPRSDGDPEHMVLAENHLDMAEKIYKEIRGNI